MVNHLLAMNPGTAGMPIDGIATKEPAFGLDAYWIKENQKDQAQNLGYTVVDLQTVVTTHLSETIKRHAHELLGRQETQTLIDHLAEYSPKVVEDLVPAILPLGSIQKVLQNLLEEKVSVRDLLSIMECLAEYGNAIKHPSPLTELVRQAVGRTIVQPYLNERGELAVMVLNPELEHKLNESIQNKDAESYLVLDPAYAQKVLESINKTIQGSAFSIQPILLVNANLRLPLRRVLERVLPNLVLISQSEIPPQVAVVTVGAVGAV